MNRTVAMVMVYFFANLSESIRSRWPSDRALASRSQRFGCKFQPGKN